MKQQQRCPLEVGTFPEPELVDEGRGRLTQGAGFDPTAAPRQRAKALNREAGQIFDRNIRHGHAIPGAALLAQQEAVECGTLQFLKGAAAALVVVAAIADGRGIGRCNHFKVFPAAFPAQIDFDQDAK